MDPNDANEANGTWEPQEPPSDFADRVMERIRDAETAPASARARRIPLRAGVAGGLALAASVVLAIGWHGHHALDHGDAIAAERTEVRVGERSIAVLEPGAHVSWNGDDVSQTGDVFYRVEKGGGAFRVHTAAGDVQVLGTCFRVQTKEEDPVNGREVKAGVIGAALSAVAFVSVYEGKVALSHASERVTLTAGESGQADGTGVHRTGGGGAGEGATGDPGAAGSDPLVAANANLADSVREYKRRLEAIEAQKAAIARQLADAQEKLAVAANDGQAIAHKDEYDLSQDDWKELAAQGRVKSKTACDDPASWNITPGSLGKMGLAPADAQPIHDVLQKSAQRVWGVIRPLCIQALQGDARMADKLGPGTCTALVNDVARQNKEDTEEELRAVAEIRAGMRPVPSNLASLGAVGQILYAQSGETKLMEQELTQSIGPADAHAFVFGDEGCWNQSSSTVGPRPILPSDKPTVNARTLSSSPP